SNTEPLFKSAHREAQRCRGKPETFGGLGEAHVIGNSNERAQLGKFSRSHLNLRGRKGEPALMGLLNVIKKRFSFFCNYQKKRIEPFFRVNSVKPPIDTRFLFPQNRRAIMSTFSLPTRRDVLTASAAVSAVSLLPGQIAAAGDLPSTLVPAGPGS